MPGSEVNVSISSNNHEIEKIFLDLKPSQEIKFVKDSHSSYPYSIFLIDIQKDLTNISQSLINTYSLCREKGIKLAVIILHGDSIDIEKNHYFQKMLDDLGKSNPLHRLIITKDIYQHVVSTPVTPFDDFLHHAITTKTIVISRKGENLYFPIDIADFVNALIKTLFLSNTSGESFWILGDPIKDLELAYLLKKNISSLIQDEPEINATEQDDPKSTTLLSTGNKSRGELNWQPEEEIVDNLKQITARYLDNPTTETVEGKKPNPVHQFLTWVYRPRPKKENQLPTLKKIGKKLAGILFSALIIGGVACILATIFSLQQLNNSIKQALNGNLNQSVSSLNNSIQYKEIGESLFTPIVPLANLISPKGTEKIFNLYSLISYTTTSLENLHQTYVMAENLLLSLNSPENKTNYSDLSLALHSNLSQVYENINQISFLSSGNRLPGFIDKIITNSPEFKNLKNLEEQVAQCIKVTDIIPAVFSPDKAKTILVILQNNHSLQPTGGDIDYFLLLTLDQGKLISKKYLTLAEVQKLYLDSLVIAKKNSRFATPPAPTFQDITQNPDFPLVASGISAFITKTLKISPDFVIATSNSLIEQLLTEEKSSILVQYQENFIKPNGAESYRELVDQYLERLFNQDISLPVLGRTLAKTIGDNQILIWAEDKTTERLLASQSYSGVISPHPCNAGIVSIDKCIAQTTYLSESMSITPSTRINPWSSRALSHTIKISSPTIEHEYRLTYKKSETSTVTSPINIIYHLYLPSPSTINQLLLNDLPTSIKFAETVKDGSFDYYKIPLVLQPDQDAVISLKATTLVENFTSPFSYSVTEYRQPGTQDPGINLKIIYPQNLRPLVVTSQFSSQPSEMQVTLPPHTSSFGFTLGNNME
jgi:hypothetical protein